MMQDKLMETFWAIRKNPRNYIQEESIWSLRSFLDGYSYRCHREELESRLGYGANRLYWPFHAWLQKTFGPESPAVGVHDIVYSYSDGPVDAFHRLYVLFESFLAESEKDPSVLACATPLPSPQLERMDLCPLLRSIRKRPAMYVGYTSFERVFEFLAGYERCGRDLGLDQTEDERIFDGFKHWIENERFKGGNPRPWQKLVRHRDFTDAGALPAFFELLDEYAANISQPNLFKEAED